ncbi:MAG: single-stranded DNA-binding protein [Anaerolineae bacterium]|nr:single-stranded DNA-binding protein [Anaerolineae bacterium]
MAYQKLIIVGNLGRDPEMRYTPDGTPVTTLNIATSFRWNSPDGSKNEETTWFRVTAWRRDAEIAAQYLTKGRQVMIEGRLTPDKATGGPRIWTRQDGTAGASYEVRADRIVLLADRGGEMAGAPGAAEAPEEYEAEGDIPF